MKLYFTLNGEENCDENKKSFFWIIDRLDKEDDGTFIINDYKTNKNLPPEDKEEYIEQLTLYALWIRQKYGKRIYDSLCEFICIKRRIYLC